MKILIIDDDSAMCDLISRAFKKKMPESVVLALHSAQGALDTITSYRPDLIVLDWMFKGAPAGLSLCKQIKAQRYLRHIPVLMISGQRITDKDQWESIACGADVYLSKPFELKHLAGYAQSLLSRGDKLKASSGMLQVGVFILNLKEHQIVGPQGNKRLGKSLFKVLWHLAGHYPKTISVTQIVWQVWKSNVRDHAVAVAISRLNKRLEGMGCWVEAVAGRGYRLRIGQEEAQA